MATLTAGSSITLTLDQDDVLTTVGNATANITLASGQSKGTQTLTGTQYLGPYGQYATVILTAVTDTTYTSTSRTSAATPAVYATDSSGNVTGLVEPSGLTMPLQGYDPARAFAPANKIINPNTYGNGTLAQAMSGVTLSGVTGAIVKDTSGTLSTQSGTSLKIAFAGNGLEVVDLATNFTVSSSNRWIGFWALRQPANTDANSQKPYPCSLYFTGNGFSTFAQLNVTFYPGLHYYVLPLPDPSNSSPPWSLALPATITTMRIRGNNGGTGQSPSTWITNAGVTINNYAQNGDVVYIGDIYLDPPKPKAKFLICFDDCKSDLIVPGGAAVVDGTGATAVHSYVSFVASYGFPVNAFVITGAVGNWVTGQGSYLGWDQLAKMRDEWGVCFGAHSHTHPGGADVVGASGVAGIRLLGQYGYGLVGAVAQTAGSTGLSFTPTQGNAGIIADLTTCHDTLNKKGFSSATKYFALPQGGYDWYVNQAIEQMGYKMVRGVTGQHSHPWAFNTFAPAGGNENISPLVTVGSSLQTDGSATQATIQAYVDSVIANGAIGSNYCHSWASLSAARQQTKWLCDYLAIKKAAGLIDVVRMDEL